MHGVNSFRGKKYVGNLINSRHSFPFFSFFLLPFHYVYILTPKSKTFILFPALELIRSKLGKTKQKGEASLI